MSSNGSELQRGAPPYRPRHQITRSISELSSPIRLHRYQSHRGIKDRHREGPAPQAAPPPTSGRTSIDDSRPDGVTPNLSPNPSRRASLLNHSSDDASAPTNPVDMPIAPTTRDPQEHAVFERQRALAQESDLRKSLTDLESFSISTTRRLNDIYYSVVEKLDALQRTIIALRELASLSQRMHHAFNVEAEGLVTDISSQLDAFGQFEDQQKRIEKLQGRIHAGRDKIGLLSKRVDVVRERIENWERADKEWQERTRRRLKAVWVITSVLLFLMLLLYLSAQYVPESMEETTVRLANDSLNTLRNITGSKMLGLDTGGATSAVDDVVPGAPESASPDALRVFDEL